MDLQKSGEIEEGCAASCCGNSKDEDVPDSVHKNIIRIIGFLALCFGFIEVGIGGGIFDFVRDVGYGAFWAGMM
jgi:hypothetical protein